LTTAPVAGASPLCNIVIPFVLRPRRPTPNGVALD